MYKLNYTPTTLGVQSRKEIISGGTQTKKVEYRCYRGHTSITVLPLLLAFSHPKRHFRGGLTRQWAAFKWVPLDPGTLHTKALLPHCWPSYGDGG
jgi:hypothetical protein